MSDEPLNLVKKEDTQPFEAVLGGDPFDELSDSQRRAANEIRVNKSLGTGSSSTSAADLMLRMGATFGSLGKTDHAVEFYEKALEGLRESNNPHAEAGTLHHLARAHWKDQNAEKAIKTYQLAADMYYVLNQPRAHATALNCIGLVYDQQGDLEGALGYYEQALAIFWDSEDKIGEANTLDVIGGVQRRLGQGKAALHSHKQALAIRLKQEDKSGEAATRHALALVYEDIGEDEKAIIYYEWALRLRCVALDRVGEAITCYNLAKLYLRKGHLIEAETLLMRTVELDELTNHPDLAKDQIELAAVQERRRKAGLVNPVGDSTGSYPRMKADAPAEPPIPEDSTLRHAAIKWRPSTKQ